MIPWWVAGITFFVGSVFGIIVMALLAAAGQADREMKAEDIDSEILSELDPLTKRDYDQPS